MPARSTSTRRPAGQARSRSGSTARKRPPAKRNASRRPAARRKQPTGLWGVISGGWGLLARGAGGLARSVARPEEAEPLAPEHRRDGVGLAVLGLSIVLGAAVWSDGIGPVGAGIAEAARWVVGALVVVLPVVLFFAALRLLRHGPRPEARGRLAIGWLCTLVSVLGIAHVVGGGATAGPPQGEPGSGGLPGWAVGTPLTAGIGSAVTVVLLALLAFFGVLVITATPVHQIPERLAGLADRLLGRDEYDEDDYDDEDDEEYDEDDEPQGRRGRRAALSEDLLTTGPIDHAAFDAAAEATATTEPEHVPLRRGPVVDRTAPPEDLPPITEPEQLSIQPVEGDYKLPSVTMLRPGTPPRARSKSNDVAIEAITGVLEQFSIDAAVTGFTRGPTVTRY
jgi:S-DNA-T family DNA segregation ATPase FtsK/SpoIIIE